MPLWAAKSDCPASGSTTESWPDAVSVAGSESSVTDPVEVPEIAAPSFVPVTVQETCPGTVAVPSLTP